MSLMSGSTSLEQLKKKYEDFKRFSLEISVDGTKMSADQDIHIYHLNLDLTSGLEASGCSFLVGGCYSFEDQDFDKKAEKFQIGAKIEIFLGYQKVESVFEGYINAVSYEFGLEEEPVIRVRGMDAKGLLMKNRRLEAFKEKKADAVVKKLLSEQPVSHFLSGKSIDSCPEEEVPLRSGMKTDYEIIAELARKLGYEFFIIQGKAYFQKGQKNTSPITTLTPEFGVQECICSVSGNTLVQSVEVRSIHSGNGKLISGSSKLTGSFGKKASKLYQGTTQVFYEAGVSSPKEAGDRAEARMEEIKSGFGSLELVCRGIPELVPGRFLKLDGFSSSVNGSYYIRSVTHSCSPDGFQTRIQGCRKHL